jgi:hypothetical protein
VPAFGQSQLTVTNGQSVTAGPGTPVGANFSNIIVNTSGNLTGTNLTVQNANFNGSTRILLTRPATASLTNTAIALQNSTTGISAAGPNALLTLGGSLNFINAGGFSNRVGVAATGGAQVNITQGSTLSLDFSGGRNIGLNADGEGTRLTVTGATVSLPGTSTDIGVNATGGAQVEIADSFLDESNSNGGNDAVLKSVGTDSKPSVTNTSVSMAGTNNDIGVAVTGGAEGQINGGSVTLTTGSNNNTVLQADGTGSMLFVIDTKVSMLNGNNTETGVAATGGAQVGISGGSVELTITGPNSTGLRADASMLSANGTNVSLTVTGGPHNDVGVRAINGAMVHLTSGSVVVNASGGSGNIGAASGSGSTAILDSTPVTVLGDSNIGVQADGTNSILSANDSTITVNGNNEIGALAQNSGAIGTRNETITVNGNNPTGVQLSQSLYLYGEYDYSTGDHIQEPWSVSAGFSLEKLFSIWPQIDLHAPCGAVLFDQCPIGVCNRRRIHEGFRGFFTSARLIFAFPDHTIDDDMCNMDALRPQLPRQSLRKAAQPKFCATESDCASANG